MEDKAPYKTKHPERTKYEILEDLKSAFGLWYGMGIKVSQVRIIRSKYDEIAKAVGISDQAELARYISDEIGYPPFEFVLLEG